MTKYGDLKIAPAIHDVLTTAARDEYQQTYRAVSRSANEAAILWLIFRADDDVRNRALNEHGFDGIQDLIECVASHDGDDGRFADDSKFDPLAGIRTDHGMDSGPQTADADGGIPDTVDGTDGADDTDDTDPGPVSDGEPIEQAHCQTCGQTARGQSQSDAKFKAGHTDDVCPAGDAQIDFGIPRIVLTGLDE